MQFNHQTRQQATRWGRVGIVLAVSALSLGSAQAEPFAAGDFVAKVQSLHPVPIESSDTEPLVEQEVIQIGAPVQTTAVRRSRGGSCGLDTIKRRESGGNYGAVSRSGKYRGAYQFDQRTWQSVGGSGDPATASPSEQDQRAAALYAKRGSAPWSVCH